jgi:hypothetical protein
LIAIAKLLGIVQGVVVQITSLSFGSKEVLPSTTLNAI